MNTVMKPAMRMRGSNGGTFRAVFLAVALPAVLAAQTDPQERFEVVSIKPSPKWTGGPPPMESKKGGPGTPSPTRITFRNYPLRDLLIQAYEVQPYQLSGPAWLVDVKYLQTDTFDLDATLPAGATRQDLSAMLSTALAERFNLKMHQEKRKALGFALVLGSHGHKLQASSDDPRPNDLSGSDPIGATTGRDGFPTTPSGYSGLFVTPLSDRMRVKFMRRSMGQFAEWLSTTQLKRPVVDRTGLAGKYDFILEYRRDSATAMGSAGELSGNNGAVPDLFAAVQSQLGLKLVTQETEIEMLIIDHADRMPSAN